MRIATIDPGLRYCGVAVGDGKFLTHAALVKNPVKKDRGHAAWTAMASAVSTWLAPHGPLATLVCETPKQYQAGHHGGKRVDPDDILQLQGVTAAACATVQAGSVKTVYPYEWKRQLPKDVGYNRILSRLSPNELVILRSVDCAPSLLHNVADAVGILLHHMGRKIT